ncbi:MAG: NAD-binding protein, partial [Alloprevotella sp.]|nr:NAD-binding protein [Alloprevotella sp.]
MRIVIAGAGEVGTHLATLLTRDKHDIVLITEDEQTYNSACSREDLLKVSGCPTSISFLKESGVDQCKLFVAVTPDESRNMTSCMLAKKLGAEITVARVDTMEYM